MIREQHIADLHGPAMAEADALQEDLQQIEAVLYAVKNDLQGASHMRVEDYDAHVKTFEQATSEAPDAPGDKPAGGSKIDWTGFHDRVAEILAEAKEPA